MITFCRRFLTISLLLASQMVANSQTIPIPKGVPIVIDGNCSSEEWQEALRQELAGGGEIFLKHDDTHLYLCLRGAKPGWGHIYLTHDDTIHVLHASAALGTAIYRRGNSEVWQPVQGFSWTMRDTTLSKEAQAARETFLESHGWVANTMMMGTPETLEFKIARKILNSDTFSCAALFASAPDSPQYWPQSLQDDCLAEDLVRGNTPAGLKFKRESWAKLKF